MLPTAQQGTQNVKTLNRTAQHGIQNVKTLNRTAQHGTQNVKTHNRTAQHGTQNVKTLNRTAQHVTQNVKTLNRTLFQLTRHDTNSCTYTMCIYCVYINVSYKKQELLALCEYLTSPPVFGGISIFMIKHKKNHLSFIEFII
jgi:UV DNA damage repair endonuclease